MPDHSVDESLIRQALHLARAGVGLTSPNPCVGAVIADQHGDVLGSGTYTYDGLKHAEILALEQAGEMARGATLYINLEPCSHQGRTGPCADAVIAAGIMRVVASTTDPNPTVSGRGFARLRQAGVQVASGMLEEEARPLNDAFAKYIRYKLPLVTLKAGMTLDGKIAPPPEDLSSTPALGAAGPTGGWITSDEARAHVQQLRHQHDAILVGVGTILADNPLLTDRSGRSRRRPLLRVILDSRLRLPLESRLVQSATGDGAAKSDVIVFCSSADEKKKAQLEQLSIRIEMLPATVPDGRPDLPAILRRLAQLEIASVLIEGGATVNGTALMESAIDKVFLYYAPKILGGTGSIPFAAGPGFHRVSEAAQVKSLVLHR